MLKTVPEAGDRDVPSPAFLPSSRSLQAYYCGVSQFCFIIGIHHSGVAATSDLNRENQSSENNNAYPWLHVLQHSQHLLITRSSEKHFPFIVLLNAKNRHEQGGCLSLCIFFFFSGMKIRFSDIFTIPKSHTAGKCQKQDLTQLALT